MLQLVCMTIISQDDANLELFLRKAQKIDNKMGQILEKILRKSINPSKNKKMDENQLLNQIENLLRSEEITISK